MMILIICKIIFFAFLLCTLSFFSCAETAITSLSAIYLRKTRETKKDYLRRILFLESHTQEVMTAIIIGMNLSLVGMSVVLLSLETDISKYYGIKSDILNISFPFISIILALILGNIFPKTIARYNAEKIGITILPTIIKFTMIFKIVINFLLNISDRITKLFIKKKESQHIKAAEIDFLLSNEKTSPLSADSRKFISNIMDFTERKISQVMVPLSGIFALDIDLPKEEIIKRIIETKYSRVPIYKGNISNIVGIIYAKDLAIAWRNFKVIVVEDLIHSAYYVSENSKINNVLKEFKTGHCHVAIVVNEFGSTIGIASIEDLLEEIVGEVLDEHDLKEKTIKSIDQNEYIIQAYESISSVNDELDIDIPLGNYTTINGWVLELFNKIPVNGEKINWNNYSIEVQDADLKKVNRIVLKKCTTQ
ncbi:MAG: hemolysin family protein [Endomicrobium sp.]|nr:hemolysin family protein [Endomicrobium sp.]